MKFLIVVIFGDKSLRKWVWLGLIFVATVIGMGLLRLMSVPVA